jgi:Co/Zn/Cd efflux system component
MALTATAAPLKPEAALAVEKPAGKNRFKMLLIMVTAAVVLVAGYFIWQKSADRTAPTTSSDKPLATQTVNGLAVNLLGELRNGQSELLIEFKDASGELVDVGTVKFDIDMNMPGMVMHSGSTIERTSTPGRYSIKVKPDMAGDWMATLQYEGPRGTGKVSFAVNVKR